MSKVTPIAYLLVAFLLSVFALVSLIALVGALTVRDTLTAVDSAVGAAVMTLALAIMAAFLFRAGWRRWRDATRKNP